ncbi:MAG: hypothetical protein A2X86_10890 [Bdellovibrionales bacterium GWA2_49_15]|nr:MAG: hypothetical protein A2X86_10890 [Bdellovibrionales bacterium GWA2_49_15]HAZ11482.1 hypothetical protein [Bdellovibrionales bacterium]
MTTPLNLLGIYREAKYSNHAVDADCAILDAVMGALAVRLGESCSIVKIHPERDSHLLEQSSYDLILSMAQDETILAALEELESKGAVVLNSSRAIRNCFRIGLSNLLSEAAFSYPRSTLISVNSGMTINSLNFLNISRGFWIKRGDYHALLDEDVTYVESFAAVNRVLGDFKNRGIAKAIIQEHCQGELFKFYGVRDSFFALRHMGKTTKDRYLTVSGDPHIAFDRQRLESLAHRAARKLGLDYFGGDCVVNESDKLHIIDFNDWPSFRTCRNEVAPYMASYALRKFESEVSYDNCLVQRV